MIYPVMGVCLPKYKILYHLKEFFVRGLVTAFQEWLPQPEHIVGVYVTLKNMFVLESLYFRSDDICKDPLPLLDPTMICKTSPNTLEAPTSEQVTELSNESLFSF